LVFFYIVIKVAVKIKDLYTDKIFSGNEIRTASRYMDVDLSLRQDAAAKLFI